MVENNNKLSEIISRIVKIADPERIILFGSGARDDMGLDSDLDLLVVKSGAKRRQLAQKIYKNMFGVNQPLDVVVVTPKDLERYKDVHSLVIKSALEEGKVVYEKEGRPQTTG